MLAQGACRSQGVSSTGRQHVPSLAPAKRIFAGKSAMSCGLGVDETPCDRQRLEQHDGSPLADILRFEPVIPQAARALENAGRVRL